VVVLDGRAVGQVADAVEQNEWRAFLDAQQPRFVFAGGYGLDGPAAAGDDQTIGRLQVLVERAVGQVDILQAGAAGRGQVGSDEDNRLVVDEAQPVDVDDGRARPQAQIGRDVG